MPFFVLFLPFKIVKMHAIESLKEDLAQTIRNYNDKGWSPATSTNYSFKEINEQSEFFVSRSGVDKSNFIATDFIQVDKSGLPTILNPNAIPSAETIIHSLIYKLFPETTVVLHSHSVYPVLLSKHYEREVSFEGYEVQKGFSGETTHTKVVSIPILQNSQDMRFFQEELPKIKKEIKHHSFIIKQHGTYAWGKNLFEAKRHLETLEYLCHCKWLDR